MSPSVLCAVLSACRSVLCPTSLPNTLESIDNIIDDATVGILVLRRALRPFRRAQHAIFWRDTARRTFMTIHWVLFQLFLGSVRCPSARFIHVCSRNELVQLLNHARMSSSSA